MPTIHFALNRSFIQSELCVQKDKKDNTCQGACYLKKLVQAQHQSGQAVSPPQIEELAWVQPAAPAPEVLLAAPARCTPNCYLRDQNMHDQLVLDLPVPPPWTVDHRC